MIYVHAAIVNAVLMTALYIAAIRARPVTKTAKVAAMAAAVPARV